MWFLPSRGRAHLIERLWKACMPTMRGVLAYDIDQTNDYVSVPLPPTWERLGMQRTHLSAKCNRLLEHFPDEPWYGIICDDQVPATPGWDRLLPQAAGAWRIAWADDCLHKRIGASAFGGELVRALGWMQCPSIKHFYLDDVHELIVKELDCGVYCADVKIPHLHFTTGGTPWDATYAQRPSHGEDALAFAKWKEYEWPALKARLQRVMPTCSMSAA